ncbi:hypothetical protein [Synechococcus sp. PCC 7335]|uniref:hypothetical protein n=1 Tax=Synechococcus sp. (strain ATCC 29403 / PCC 7335) TaxID=91464 RepID=UPI0012F9B0CF|nr:hypothetical protein [Synechococcus sp. PCC 7335]
MIYSQVSVNTGTSTFKNLSETVVLPPVRSKHFVSQRHEVNPALAFNLLRDIQSEVSIWHEQLRQIVDAIHALHDQGPMVDGWLESSVARSQSATKDAGVDAAILRHGDLDVLLQYVEVISSKESSQVESGKAESSQADGEKATTTYRLCHMDQSGRVISQHCPPEQMGMVSMAIARYQKFRQLMSQKQAIEAKLQRTVDALTGTRSAIRDGQ